MNDKQVALSVLQNEALHDSPKYKDSVLGDKYSGLAMIPSLPGRIVHLVRILVAPSDIFKGDYESSRNRQRND